MSDIRVDESCVFGVCTSSGISSRHWDLRRTERFVPIVIIVGHPFQVMVVVIFKAILVIPRHLPITVEVYDGSRSLDPEGEHRVHLR